VQQSFYEWLYCLVAAGFLDDADLMCFFCFLGCHHLCACWKLPHSAQRPARLMVNRTALTALCATVDLHDHLDCVRTQRSWVLCFHAVCGGVLTCTHGTGSQRGCKDGFRRAKGGACGCLRCLLLLLRAATRPAEGLLITSRQQHYVGPRMR
jgi:hypothetical protein